MRDVMEEDRALELYCPYQDEGKCVGGRCMAWTVSWENDSEGFCAALRPTYEREIKVGWQRHGRHIMGVVKALRGMLDEAQRERDAALAELEQTKKETTPNG